MWGQDGGEEGGEGIEETDVDCEGGGEEEIVFVGGEEVEGLF